MVPSRLMRLENRRVSQSKMHCATEWLKAMSLCFIGDSNQQIITQTRSPERQAPEKEPVLRPGANELLTHTHSARSGR